MDIFLVSLSLKLGLYSLSVLVLKGRVEGSHYLYFLFLQGMSLKRQRPGILDDTHSDIDTNTSYSNTYYEEDFSSLDDSSLDEGTRIILALSSV